MVSEDETEYELVMPFVTVASKGGPHDDAAYVAGYEMGRLEERLANKAGRGHQETLHGENLPQADIMGMRYGYTVEATPVLETGWALVIFKPMKEEA